MGKAVRIGLGTADSVVAAMPGQPEVIPARRHWATPSVMASVESGERIVGHGYAGVDGKCPST